MPEDLHAAARQRLIDALEDIRQMGHAAPSVEEFEVALGELREAIFAMIGGAPLVLPSDLDAE